MKNREDPQKEKDEKKVVLVSLFLLCFGSSRIGFFFFYEE